MASHAEKTAGLMLKELVWKEIDKRAADYFKEEEPSSKLLAHMSAPFNPDYMNINTTRDGRRIYWKKGARESVLGLSWWSFKVRAHEGQHMWDWKKLKFLFPAAYGLPHTLAVIIMITYGLKLWGLASLGALIGGVGLGYIMPRKWWWFFPWATAGLFTCTSLGIAKTGYWSLWLVAIALLISPAFNWFGAAFFRAWAEFRGYTMNMAVNYWKHGRVKEETLEWIEDHFVGPKYYFMLPWRKYVRWRLKRNLERIESGKILQRPWAAKVYNVMQKSGMAVIKYGDNT